MIRNIHLPKPCSENWQSMKPVDKGRFCGSCMNKVHDLRAESVPELAVIFEQNNGQLCGRIYESQLQAYNAWADKQNKYFSFTKIRSAISAFSMLVFSLCIAPLKKSAAAPLIYLENKLFDSKEIGFKTLLSPEDSVRVLVVHVKGFDEEPFVGVFVEVFDSLRKLKGGEVTDPDGNATVQTLQKNGFLKISFLGYLTQEIKFSSYESNFTTTLIEDNNIVSTGIICVWKSALWKRILFFPYYQSRKLARKIKNS